MKKRIIQHFQTVRARTEALCAGLQTEDYVIQAMEDVSPPKWHLAHTAWFFETFLLQRFCKHYSVFDVAFHYLFNSYYQGVGNPYPRPQRGFISRPSIDKIYQYRRAIDAALPDLIEDTPASQLKDIVSLITLGLEHEQQHQELLLMDIKYNFFIQPNYPIYHPQTALPDIPILKPSAWLEVAGAEARIGHKGKGFAFDNELPEHSVLIAPFLMGNRLVSNEEYLFFMENEGYDRLELWLADGWDWIRQHRIHRPLYWQHDGSQWWEFTLSGLQPLNLQAPVAHVSFFEADAYTRWCGGRLPTEMEWEHYVNLAQLSTEGHFMEKNLWHPQPASNEQFFGDLWEWTSSAYLPYPGFQTFKGALGEYNGKFMNNQRVLRGGSCITPQKHIRASYRNFFQSDKRWPFTGIRVALDSKGAR